MESCAFTLVKMPETVASTGDPSPPTGLKVIFSPTVRPLRDAKSSWTSTLAAPSPSMGSPSTISNTPSEK